MKKAILKFLLTSFLMMLLPNGNIMAASSSLVEEEFVFSDIYSTRSSNKDLDEVTVKLNEGEVSLYFERNNGNDTPKYYTSNSTVHVRTLNTITFSCDFPITKIIFQFYDDEHTVDDDSDISFDSGSFTYKKSKLTCTWEGEVTTVVMTAEKTLYINSITVTYDSSVKKDAHLEYSEDEVELCRDEMGLFESPELTYSTDGDITCTSSNINVAGVDNDGTITLTGNIGTATVTAISEETDKYYADTATCTITVTKSTKDASITSDTIIFSTLGYSNSEDVVKVRGTNVTLYFERNSSNFGYPSYYTSENSLHFYGFNTIEFFSVYKITSIEVTVIGGNEDAEIKLLLDGVNGTEKDSLYSWTCDSTDVTLLNNNNVVYISKIVISYDTSVDYSVPTTYLRLIDDNVENGDTLNITDGDDGTTYVIVTFGSDNDTADVWSDATEKDGELTTIDGYGTYVAGNIAATDEGDATYNGNVDGNNTFDIPIAGAYLMMEPKRDGTMAVVVRQGDGTVYVCDETGLALDSVLAECADEDILESNGKGWKASDTCYVRYSFAALAGKTYFIMGYDTNIGVAGYTFTPTTATISSNEITINETDETALSDATTLGQSDITLTRSFTKGGWTGIVLPFSVSPSMTKEMFGDDVEIIHFYKVSNDTLYLMKHYYQMIVAGTPIFLYSDTTINSPTFSNVTYGVPAVEYGSDDEWEVTGQTVPEIEAQGVDDTTSGWTVTGSYTKTTTDDHVYILGFTTSGTDGSLSNNFYEYTSGRTLNGTRAWLDDTTAGNTQSSIKAIANSGISDDNETTGIRNVIMGDKALTNGSGNGDGSIYNLGGQRVRATSDGISGLPKGIYIVNGRKVVVK